MVYLDPVAGSVYKVPLEPGQDRAPVGEGIVLVAVIVVEKEDIVDPETADEVVWPAVLVPLELDNVVCKVIVMAELVLLIVDDDELLMVVEVTGQVPVNGLADGTTPVALRFRYS
jgi:hypothetical protein